MTSNRSSVAMVILFLAIHSYQVAAAEENVNLLATLRSEHPRLLFTLEDQQRIVRQAATDALLARLIQQNQINAAAMLDEAPVRYEIPDGKRLLAQSRKCIERVMAMAMAYRLAGDAALADGAIKEMLIAAKFQDWNPSHFLDTAEMTAALAIGYDWLYDVTSLSERKAIRQAIVRLGLNEGLKSYRSKSGWTTRDNNWNQVCNGGMILGALAIAEDESKLASEVLAHAARSIPHGLSVYAPSGAYPEGPGYWQYGTAYTALTVRALETALGSDLDIPAARGLDRTGFFRMHTIGPTGWYFNFADCGMRSRAASTMFMLSQRYDQPIYAWWHRQRLASLIPQGKRIERSRQDRFFPLEIAWYDARGEQPAANDLPRDAHFKSQQDIVTMRSAWNDAMAVYVGFKAGDNRANHGHLDIGSFVLDADGVRWALDLGGDNYNLPGYFSGRRRWQYYRLTNLSHNTLVINGQIQNPDARCEVIAFQATPERTHAIVDMSDAYRDQARSVLRGIEMLQRRAVHLQDEISGADGQVRWAIVTAAQIKLDGNKATLTQNGKALQAEILAPSGARFEIMSNRPTTKQENQNEGTYLLATTITARPDQRAKISVLLQPIRDEKPIAAVAAEDLSEWPR